jgi:hypothetical protein
MAEDTTLDLFGGTFLYELKQEFLNQLVDVEFCCCGHVKKAVGGILSKVGNDFIELVADSEAIQVILFGDDNQTFTERTLKIAIPIDRICSVEDPCRKKKDPCKDPKNLEDAAAE